MKKVLMIFPNYYQYSEWHWMPTNMIFLAAALQAQGYEPVLVDDRFGTRSLTKERIREHIPNAVIVLISTASGRQLRNARELAQFVKGIRDVPVCVGGAHPSALPELTLTEEAFDFVVAGPGESAACKLTAAASRGSRDAPEDAPGLYFRNAQGAVTRTPAPRSTFKIRDLPPLPYFDERFIRVTDYLNPETHAVNYTTSSGCVGRCGFCFWHDDFRYGLFETARVLSDLARFKELYAIKNVNFDDPTFFVNPDRSTELAQGIVDSKLDIKWRANGRVDRLRRFSAADMELIGASGCHLIHVGLESASPRMLSLMNKEISFEDAMHLLKLSKQSGVRLRFHIIVGMPGETLDDLKMTCDFLERMYEFYPEFDHTVNFFTPYPGNTLTRTAQEHGYMAPTALGAYEDMELLNITHLPDDDRIIVKESSPWKEDINVPWFDDDFNREYMDAFRQWMPEVGRVRSTGDRLVEIMQ